MMRRRTLSKGDNQEGFTETHHALLFGWISRAVVELVGEKKGEVILRKAVRQYGQERGRRMALRAKANGDALTMANFMAYSEWKASSGVMEQSIVERSPHAKVYITQCPWHTAWKENGVLLYGRFYCREIDDALVHGFNPELQLDINGTKTNGAAQCEFVFRDANLTWLNNFWIGYKKTVKPGKKALMPWEYHVGHLFSTVEKVVVDEARDIGETAIKIGLREFAKRFGEQATQKVVSYRNLDF